jgi:capsular polysaccharide export protein
MNNPPLISIAMATYNGGDFIKAQLDSIINQSYKNIQIIICDDGSSDKTIDILETYIKKYPFIELFLNKEKLGYAKNFEKAIRLSTASYIALCDQDDIWEKDKLETQLREIKKIESDDPSLAIMVHSDLCMIDKNDKIFNDSYFEYRKYKLKKEKDLGHILGPCGVMGNTIMFNKALKEKALPFPIYIENHDYWISLINEIYGKRITLDRKLVKYRIHNSNTSNSCTKIKNKQTFLNLIKLIKSRDFYIPYIKTNRFQLLSYLLRNYDIPAYDKKVLIRFQEYLSNETSRFRKISNVIRYSFYKRDFLYRIIFLSGLLIRKNISKKNLYIYNILQIFTAKDFKGWGQKNTGKFAFFCNKIFKGKLTLLEDGFIRSIDLKKSLIRSFSLVRDDIGIYYDATKISKLEKILNTYDFKNDYELMNKARKAIKLLLDNNISKYNHSKDIDKSYFDDNEKKILVIAQAEKDKSLEYGLTNNLSLEGLVDYAIKENPNATIYVKIHPDDIQKNNYNLHINNKEYKIIKQDVNSISLLKNFTKVYTRTSQMGFEAILLGKECVCFGMPFYAGWGITDDRVKLNRRKRKLSVEEVFAAAYILYSEYKNPYLNQESDIIGILDYMIDHKRKEKLN